MPPSRTELIMFVRAVSSFTSAAAGAEPSKALRCPGRKSSGLVDDEEQNSMIVRLTRSSFTVV